MSILLRLKPWQLFLLTSGAYINFVLAPFYILHLISLSDWRTETLAISVFGFTVRSLWQLTLAKELHKKLPEGITPLDQIQKL